MEGESSRSDRRIAEMESTHAAKLTELREIMETEKVALRLQISALEAANQELRASIAAMAGTHGELVANEVQLCLQLCVRCMYSTELVSFRCF
jgi:hypothetical protein